MSKKVSRYFDESAEKDDEKSKSLNSKKHVKKEIVFKIKETRPWRKNVNVPKKIKMIPNPNPKFPGRVPIPKEKLEKHSRGEGIQKTGIRTGIHKKKFAKKEKNIQFANELAARSEILLTEETGFLQPDFGETSTQFTQKEIAENLDITSATKHFELKLKDFGPYRARYTRNGRHLLLGGRLGHVAAIDWFTKKLHCEMNVMESVSDICWLHLETMFAVAQKDWVYIYDNEGTELHCLKRLYRISKMEFLPYHFILATASEEGYLSWLDVSMGQIVGQRNTHMGRLNIMAQNPYNAVICLGHSKGLVSMWAPSANHALVKILCHKAPLSAIHVDPKGIYMATAAIDNKVKVWDVRQLGEPLQNYKLKSTATNVSFSHKNMLALGMGNIVEVYKDCCRTRANRAYIRHRMSGIVQNMEFCPFEDVLGVGSSWGFTSLLIPGAGEPNYDARELNPYQTKEQRKEAEVKALLEKIPADLISLDPSIIAEVDVPTLEDKIQAKQKLLYLKPPKINLEPRRKSKGKGTTVKVAKTKKILKENAKKDFIKKTAHLKNEIINKTTKTKKKKKGTTGSVLDRFL